MLDNCILKGSLDILVLQEEKDSITKSTKFNLQAFKNEISEDVYFLKVMGKLNNQNKSNN
jgi:hypothetical protein